MSHRPASLVSCLLLPCILGCACQGNPAPPPTPVPVFSGTLVPLAGNAYVTQGAAEALAEGGLVRWTRPETVVSVYIRVAQPGELRLGLQAAGGSTRSTVALSTLGKRFTVNLEGSTSRAYEAGSVNVDKAGYLKLDLQGVSKEGSAFGEVSALVVTGSASANLVFADRKEDFYWSRRGPSVHMTYTTPAQTEYFYNELTIPKGEDAIGSYYMANGFGEGYCGIQVNSETERRVLFSVWDPEGGGKTTLVRKGPDVTTNTFGGEGTGGQSYLVYPWVAGTTYRFLTRATPDGASSTQYSAWFYAPEAGTWRFLATWTRPKISTYLTGCHSFLENFLDFNGHLGRRCLYGNQWALPRGGSWTECTQGRFTGDATALHQQRLDYAGGLDQGQFYLRNGGFFSEMVPLNQTFSRPATGRRPEIDVTKLP